MGEIDRIHPVLRPVLGLKPTDRVQPESDRHHQQHNQDELELKNTTEPESPEEPHEPEEPAPLDSTGGLDISI